MPPDSLTHRVRALHVFRHLPLGDLDRLLSQAEIRSHAPGGLLMEARMPVCHVHVILSGRVRLNASLASGEEISLGLSRPGEWIGDGPAVDRGPALFSARAHEPLETLRLCAARLRAWLDDTPDLGDWIRAMAARSRERERALLGALQSKPETRSPRKGAPAVPSASSIGAEAFIGSSDAARATRRAILRAARCELPALLVGETGTGKELVARAVHAESARRDGPFVPVNCGALQEALLESELFGHERGAFTGALRAKPGLVEAARGGTLFLDEIEEMSPRLQAVLLRFLEDGEYRAVGATGTLRSNARIVAACQAAPETAPSSRRMREDLRYRLDVVRIALPPLRERPEDLEALAAELVERVASRLDTLPDVPSPEALRCLETARWPGNVRELRNEVERWFALKTDGGRISPDELSIRPEEVPALEPTEGASSGYGGAVRAFKAQLVRRALHAAGGNKSRAAATLGLHRSNLSRLARELGIE